MSADIFAEWLRRRGHRVIRTPSSYWYDIYPCIYEAVPYHWLISPAEDELQQLFRQNRVIAVRYSAPLEAAEGKVSYHVVYEGNDYTLDNLSRASRQNVRRGLKHVSIEPISWAKLADEGWPSRADTLLRQDRLQSGSQQWWECYCRSAEGLPGFEAWVAIADGQLVASLMAFICDDCCVALSQQSRTEYLKMRVNNALYYTFAHEVSEQPGINYLFCGLHSLDAPESVDRFKFRMGYTAKPVRQRVVFSPWLTPLFNRASRAVLSQLFRWHPSNSTLAKADGLLRFYLEGQRPLDEQNWPACLNSHRKHVKQAGQN